MSATEPLPRCKVGCGKKNEGEAVSEQDAPESETVACKSGEYQQREEIAACLALPQQHTPLARLGTVEKAVGEFVHALSAELSGELAIGADDRLMFARLGAPTHVPLIAQRRHVCPIYLG